MKNDSKKCRSLKVLEDLSYKVTPKSNADVKRTLPALVKLTNKVLVIIAGNDCRVLNSVSSYKIESDVWLNNLPKL